MAASPDTILDILNILDEPSESSTGKFNLRLARALMQVDENYIKFMAAKVPEIEYYKLNTKTIEIIYNKINNNKVNVELREMILFIMNNINKVEKNMLIVVLSTISINIFSNLFKFAFKL